MKRDPGRAATAAETSAPQARFIPDARILFSYLAAPDPDAPEVCDAVIGFGVFDLRVAETCGALYTAGRTRRIIFTGGIGAGTADLGRPEAEAFAQALARSHPGIPRETLIVENRSTNTGENVRFTLELLARDHPALTPSTGLRTALLVASPARLRRVRLTWKQLVPSVPAWGLAPESDLTREHALHAAKGLDYLSLLTGEIDRIQTYPSRGWIAHEPVPVAIIEARERLAGQSGVPTLQTKPA